MPDWTTRVIDTLDSVVDAAQGKVVRPIQKLGRAVVYGLLGSFFLVTALVLASVGAFRALVAYLPADVWAAHLIVGGIFVLGGVFLFSNRT